MRKFIVYAVVIAFSSRANGQDLHTLSLDQFSIKTENIAFKISEVIDARADNNVIGIIQRGVKNRKDLAVFESAGLQELEELLKRSDLISKEKGVVMRVSRLYVSEITAMWKETAKAELSVDFFIPYNDDYYYITTIYSTVEPRGTDVTQFHPENIAIVVENALVQFSKRENSVSSEQPYTREELMDPMQAFRDISAMPISQTTEYKDGYYTTFDEFLLNAPTVSIDCDVKLNTTSVVRCGKEETEMSVYGYARDNQLYIAFHQEFYPLIKNDNDFIFEGPREMTGKDFEETYKGIIVPRQIARRGHNAQYKVDLKTGAIKNVNGF